MYVCRGRNGVPFCLICSFSLIRHRRAIQKSRGSKVRRAEGTMESEPGAPASTANSTGTTTTTTSSSTTISSSTTAGSSSSISSTTTTTAPATSTSSGNSSGSSGGSSNTSSTSSSSTTTGRQAVPQISVYSGIPDRQTVQVSSLVLCGIVCETLRPYPHTNAQKLTYFCSTALCWHK